MSLFRSFLAVSLGVLSVLARSSCDYQEAIRSCSGNACSEIAYSCGDVDGEGDDRILVSRGFNGYDNNERALFEITVPEGEAFVVRVEMNTEETYDKLTFNDLITFSGGGGTTALSQGNHTMLWESDASNSNGPSGGWKVTMQRIDPDDIVNLFLGSLGAILGCCTCVCCLAICACCACLRSGSGNRPVAQAAPGSAAAYAQSGPAFAQAGPQQQEMQMQQPMNYAGGAPGYNPASAPFTGQPGFQPQMGGFPQQQMVGGFQPQPGFQFQPPPGQQPAFQYQPGAP